MRTYTNLKFACICGLLILRLGGFQQSLDSGSSAVIRVTANLVTVPVSVTDSSGHAVDDLRMDDFSILEDGNRQNLARIARASQSPLQLALLLDLS